MKKSACCKLKKYWLLLLVSFLVPFWLASDARAAADATLSMATTPQTVDVGDPVDLVVTENPGTNANVRAVDMFVQFDPTVLQLDSIENNATNFPSEMTNSIDNVAGTATFGTARIGGAALVGAKDVATLHFTALSAGADSAVTFETGTAIWDSGVNVTNVGGLTGAVVTVTGTDSVAPRVTSVSSDKAAGSYKAGEVVDIDVTFSEAVTSTGDVTVTLETGTTDRTCTFTVSNATTGTCNYTVQAGDTTSDLTVNTITGTIEDQAANSMTNFVPITNLAANEALVIDTTAPTVTSVSSDKAAGTYTVGEVIDIDVNFSEAVTSTGNVTVTLETGTTDRTCTFTVSNSATGTCNYTVQSTDTSADLTVNTIAGTIADQATNAMTNFAPATNLAANEAMIIDTTAPVGGSFLIASGAAETTTLAVTLNVTCPTDTWGTVQMAFGNSASPTNWTNCAATASHTLSSGNGTKTVYMRFRDGGQNTTSDGTDTITLNVADSTAPVISSGLPTGSLPHGEKQTTLTFQTDENATCKYATTSGVAYAAMISAETASSTSHSLAVSGLSDGKSYGYFVRCSDTLGNANSSDFLISFSVKKKSSDKDKKKSSSSRSISNSKKTVARGVVLIQRGKKFSKNSLVKLYFSKPGGGFYAPQTVKTSKSGAFQVSYKVNKPNGKYGWYVLDTKTGKKSKTAYYTVK